MGNNSTLFSPSMLWDLYIRYLWNYQADSWVASISSTFRILAFLIVTPFVILTLLDVTSYVIARTLGVIDDTKASTSEVVIRDLTSQSTTTADHHDETPSIHVQDVSADATPSSMESDNNTPTPPTIEPNPKLAGINVFSPAPSQPPSPTLSRRDLSESLRMTSVRPKQESGEGGGGGVGERDRARSGSFSSGESSYAVLEKDSEGEDGSGVYMRRRQPGVSDSISDS